MADTTTGTSSVSYIGSYENLVKTRKPTNEMGKDQFLQMLVTQMKSQDPLSPMQDAEYMSQMTQFSMLEQIQNLSLSFLQAQATTLIGKGVYAVLSIDDGAGNLIKKEVAGIVDSAGTESGKPYVMVGEDKVPTENIKQVYDPNALKGDANQILSGASIIGKYVTVDVKDSEGNPVSGIVERFSIKDGVMTFQLADGTNFLMSQISSMSASPPQPANPTGNENTETDSDTNQGQ